jgi:murein DD-endopeptidase MepM/ murein hydrolase activator NlpD
MFRIFLFFALSNWSLPLYIAAAPNSPHPLINLLQSSDPVFLQYQQDVEDNRMLLARYRQGLYNNEAEAFTKLAQSLTIYRYTIRPGDDIFSIAARCTIPYEAIATLNRLEHPSLLQAGKELLLPSLPALFLPGTAETDLERLVAGAHSEDAAFTIGVYPKGTKLEMECLPDRTFSSTERAFFLNTAFKYPLRVVRITSGFGLRKNPVTGTLKVHEGLDLAAPLGTPVYACREGIVSSTGYNEVYGNYIIISHEGGWTSLYGHLASITINLNSPVHSSTVIGTVGMTGQTTGPHLHFELRQDGKARDPASFLPGKGTNR